MHYFDLGRQSHHTWTPNTDEFAFCRANAGEGSLRSLQGQIGKLLVQQRRHDGVSCASISQRCYLELPVACSHNYVHDVMRRWGATQRCHVLYLAPKVS